MTVTRIHEDPRVTRPYDESSGRRSTRSATGSTRELAAGDVRLTMGGEPTFVSIDDMDGAEWNYTAHSPRKRELAEDLLRRLRRRFAPGGLLHFGQGKWYPGEPLPRWALSCYWRRDGEPLWEHERDCCRGLRDAEPATPEDAGASPRSLRRPWALARLRRARLRGSLERPARRSRPAGQRRSARRGPRRPGDARKLARQLAGAIGTPVGYVLPLQAHCRAAKAAAPRMGELRLAAAPRAPVPHRGDSPMGYRLPLASLPAVLPADEEPVIAARSLRATRRAAGSASPRVPPAKPSRAAARPRLREVVRTALCVEARDGRLHVFLPPVATWRTSSRSSPPSRRRRARSPAGLSRAIRRPTIRASPASPSRPTRASSRSTSTRQPLGRAGRQHRQPLRGGAPRAARHREVHAGRPPHRHRRRQPRDARRPHRRRQPAAAPARPAAQPDHLLAGPPGALLSLLRHVHRPDQPEPARGRGARRRALRTGHRLPADGTLPPGQANEKPWLVDRILRNCWST